MFHGNESHTLNRWRGEMRFLQITTLILLLSACATSYHSNGQIQITDKENGWHSISVVGNPRVGSHVVRDMMFLAVANLSEEQSKPYFVLADRKKYVVFWKRVYSGGRADLRLGESVKLTADFRPVNSADVGLPSGTEIFSTSEIIKRLRHLNPNSAKSTPHYW
jgi:hypothetical protein